MSSVHDAFANRDVTVRGCVEHVFFPAHTQNPPMPNAWKRSPAETTAIRDAQIELCAITHDALACPEPRVPFCLTKCLTDAEINFRPARRGRLLRM